MHWVPMQWLLYFNPRSREGSDRVDQHFFQICILFQSTLPRRERLAVILVSNYLANISIHAPAKGATITHACHLLERIYFNPRSREGSDSIYKVLQFFHSNFNPRSREGSDGKPNKRNIIKFISIHAPAKGATL